MQNDAMACIFGCYSLIQRHIRSKLRSSSRVLMKDTVSWGITWNCFMENAPKTF